MIKLNKSNSLTKSKSLVETNIDSLKVIFPEAVTEGKVDLNVLSELLGDYVEKKEERYSFSWFGKSKSRYIAQAPSTGTLRPDVANSVNWDSAKNLFIEGDNLEVLKLLQKSYHQKIKMIYIDPPYNTGKDFVYKDNFQDNIQNYLTITQQLDSHGNKYSANTDSSGRFHTDWLNMIYPRLKLARNLLTDDGVIFISIDDSEQANLRKVCDEIFGEDNFINNLIWQKKYSPSNDAKWLSDNHDFILCYAKNKDIWRPNLLPRTEKQNAAYTNRDNDPRGAWKAGDLSVKSYSAANDYEITTPSGRVVSPPASACWRVSREKFNELVKDNRIWFGEDGNNVPAIKRFLSEVKQGITPLTLWTYQEVGHNQTAKQELKKLFPETKDIFDTPKPVSLIDRLLDIGSNEDSIILDFFAGSGSTAQAVVEKNLKDNGKRTFITVQIPEPTGKKDFKYISDFTKERIKRVTENVDGSGFKAFKLDSTNVKTWEADFDNLIDILENNIDSIKQNRNAEDVLYEILLKYGLELTYPITEHSLAGKTIYEVAYGSLIVCLDDDISIGTVEAIGKLKQDLDSESTRVVFNDSGFADDAVKVNAVQLLKQYGIDDVKSI